MQGDSHKKIGKLEMEWIKQVAYVKLSRDVKTEIIINIKASSESLNFSPILYG